MPLAERGEDIVEYALLASLLSIIAIATLYAISPEVREIFMHVRYALMSIQSGRL